MPKPHFIFTKYTNSIKVEIPNLEALNIETIQKIQMFVQKRKGYFDFNTYSFVLQKRLEYKEFKKLVELSALDVHFQEKRVDSKPQARVSFGQYKGLFYSELPDSYLLWLKTNYMGRDREFLESELRNRKL
ncbi:hypothetical protein [Sulfurimonas sp.]